MYDIEQNPIFRAIENRGHLAPYVVPTGLFIISLICTMQIGTIIFRRNRALKWVPKTGKITRINSPWWVGLPAISKPKRRKIEVQYEYLFHGIRYEGSQISVCFGYQEKLHVDLSLAFETGKDINIFVNPDDPQKALIERNICPFEIIILGITGFLGVIFGALSFYLYWG